MSLSAIEGLLHETTGLNAASIGSDAVRHAVRIRMKARDIGDEEQYLEHVKASSEEMKQLVEGIVVPETWFFRNPEAFSGLVEEVTLHWLHASRSKFCIASLACSSGEEPYSIVMSLL